MITDTIKQYIRDALKALDLEDAPVEIELEHPGELEHGDYSTNIAFKYKEFEAWALESEIGEIKTARPDLDFPQSPNDLAKKIAEEIERNLPKEIESVKVQGVFINFYLSKTFFVNQIKKIIKKGGSYGHRDLFAGRKTIFEYTTQNLMKEFHVGHLMSHVIGNSIANIYAAEGAEVKRNSYQGDVGMHIAKVLWAVQQDGDGAFPSAETPAEKARYLGQKYAAGDTAFTTDEAAKEEVEALNEHVYKGDDEKVNKLYETARQWSQESYQSLYNRLGVELDFQFFESETASVGKEIVKKGLEEGVFEENDGAVIYRGDEEEGLHTRVFINSAGIPTYEAKDLGLMKLKHETYPYDESVIFTANEQNEYFKVVLAAADEVIPDLAEKNTHIGHGMLELADGKMSSRTGDVLSADALLDTVKQRALEKIADWVEGEAKEEIAESVAQAAIRYSILKQDASKNVVFDADQALSFEGNSGPYLQYTYARCQSLLATAREQDLTPGVDVIPKEVTDTEKVLYRFPEVVERAAREYSPHVIATYLHKVATSFNTFYGHTQIIGDDQQVSYRLALTASTAQVLKNGLSLLGIKAPEEM